MENQRTGNNQNVLITEGVILSSLLEDVKYYKGYIEELKPSDFSNDTFRIIFKSLKQYLDNEGADCYDLLLFRNYLMSQNAEFKNNGFDIIQLVENYATSGNFENYYNAFRKNNLRRALIKTNEYIIQKASNIETNPSILIENSIKMLNTVVGRFGITNDYKDAGDVAEGLFENFVKFGAEDSSDGVVIPTGFTELDRKIKGFKSGEFVIIAARPSCGKTALAVSLMLNMLLNPIEEIYRDEIGEIARQEKKTKIAFYSLEMNSKAIVKRFLSSFACVDANYINGIKKIDSDKITYKLKNAYQNLIELVKNNLFIFDKPMTITEIKSSARQIKQQQKVDIIFIDYLTRILTDSREAKEEWQKIGEISNSLKSLANELEIPIVCLSQLNRDAEEQKPRLSHLRNSGSIEQDADLILFLHREKTKEEKAQGKDLVFNKVYYNNGIESVVCEKEKDILMSIAKNRNGEIGEFNISFLSNFVKFVNTESCQVCEVEFND